MPQNYDTSFPNRIWQAWIGKPDLPTPQKCQDDLKLIVELCLQPIQTTELLKFPLQTLFNAAQSTSQRQILLLREVNRTCADFADLWQEHYLRYQQRVYNYACKLLSSRTIAEDIAQDVLTKILAWMLLQEKLGLLAKPVQWRAYLLACTRHACWEWMRKKKTEDFSDVMDTQVLIKCFCATKEDESDYATIYNSLLLEFIRRIEQKIERYNDLKRAKSAEVWERRRQVLSYLLEEQPPSHKKMAELLNAQESTISEDCKQLGLILSDILS
jgi:DNA-directed RNA polymerase specialized sigma24 family protein